MINDLPTNALFLFFFEGNPIKEDFVVKNNNIVFDSARVCYISLGNNNAAVYNKLDNVLLRNLRLI